MSVLSMLNDRCSIRRSSRVEDASTGSVRTVWTTLYLDVPCTVQFDSGSESRAMMAQDGERTATVYFPPGTDIKTTDRITDFTLGPQAGLTFSVTNPPIDGSGRAAYLEVGAVTKSGVAGDGS